MGEDKLVSAVLNPGGQMVLSAAAGNFESQPANILKVALYSARWGFPVEDRTLNLMREAVAVSVNLPSKSVARALKCALRTAAPPKFFRVLESAGCLACCYPEIAALVGTPQLPSYHPEGDVFEHTMIVLDRVCAKTTSPMVRFAALVHDLGKALTPRDDLEHRGHENRTGGVLENWKARAALPASWWQAGQLVGQLHMLVPRITTPAQIVAIFDQVLASPLSLAELVLICQADDMTGAKQPPDLSDCLCAYTAVGESDAPGGLSPRERMTWVRNQRYEAVARVYSAGHNPS